MNYSVLTACLNSERTIRKSIDSVLSQKIKPAEYIFVDGGSTDRTVQIIWEKEMFARDNNFKTVFKIINQDEKTGITGAWNLGLKEIRSDIVFILNSDDWYESDAASKVINCFENRSDAEIVVSSALFHNQSGKFTVHCKPFCLFPVLMPVIHPGCFVKKSVYDKIGYFDEKYRISADYEFLYRCRKKGIKICEIRKITVNMELGGTANRNRVAARVETLEIGRKYSAIPLLPEMAYLARLATGR